MPLYLKCHNKDENILGSKDFVIKGSDVASTCRSALFAFT